VFVTEDELVLEGPVTNVWWRRGPALFTPSLDLGILAGVTREALLELAPAHGYEVREGRFPLGDLRGAEEAFTSSSVRELLPVVELDGRPIPRGQAASTLQAALRDAARVARPLG
jgi:4-amino-4-deoxychorismate lyase